MKSLRFSSCCHLATTVSTNGFIHSFSITGFLTPAIGQHFSVQLISLVPGLLIGLWYAVTYGNWVFFAAVAASFLISVFLRRPQGRPLGAELDEEGRLRVEGRVVTRVALFWSRQQRDAVFRLVVAPTSADLASAIKLAAVEADLASRHLLGVSKSLAGVSIELSQSTPHLLILGPTGAGKSMLMRNLARSAQPLLDVDFKGGDNLAGVVALRRLSNLDSDAAIFWDDLSLILDQREAAPRQTHQPLYVFVDEFAAALASSTLASKTLERVATRGRSSSVFLIAASQSTAGIPRNIILNCQHRVLLGSVDLVDRTQLGAKGTPPQAVSESSQLVGEYLFQGMQLEFVMLKPTPKVERLEPHRSPRSNPLRG